MPYWRLFYHVVFATEGRKAMLTPQLREHAGRLRRHKAEELDCIVHAVHVQPDHAHVALSIVPARSVATVVGQMKGSSSHALAGFFSSAEPFAWQSSYGIFSYSEKDLPAVVKYIQNQDDHHAVGKLWRKLERTDVSDAP